jgi:hypothetical protein
LDFRLHSIMRPLFRLVMKLRFTPRQPVFGS